MPSTPKRTPKTGSVLLGQELRRLRGGRTLREIAQLTKTPPLANHVSTLSEAGLCEIESGKTMPSLQSLHALSVIYKTSMSQLMAYVQEERSTAELQANGRTQDELDADYRRLLQSHDWPAALATAIIGEQRAETEAKRSRWRSCRAACLSSMGQHQEAISLLTRCIERDDATDVERVHMLHNLASFHHHAGNVRMASLIAREAMELSERCDIDVAMRCALMVARATIVIDVECERPMAADERKVREAIRLLDGAETMWPSSDPTGRNWISIVRSRAYLALGNVLVADRDLQVALRTALAEGDRSSAAIAQLTLATIRERQDKWDEAAHLLKDALAGAQASSEVDFMFEACFRLFLCYRHSRPGTATSFLRRCHELFPLVTTATSWTRRYEAYQRSGP